MCGVWPLIIYGLNNLGLFPRIYWHREVGESQSCHIMQFHVMSTRGTHTWATQWRIRCSLVRVLVYVGACESALVDLVLLISVYKQTYNWGLKSAAQESYCVSLRALVRLTLAVLAYEWAFQLVKQRMFYANHHLPSHFPYRGSLLFIPYLCCVSFSIVGVFEGRWRADRAIAPRVHADGGRVQRGRWGSHFVAHQAGRVPQAQRRALRGGCAEWRHEYLAFPHGELSRLFVNLTTVGTCVLKICESAYIYIYITYMDI